MSEYHYYKTKRVKGTKLLRPMGFEFTFEKAGINPNSNSYYCDYTGEWDYYGLVNEISEKYGYKVTCDHECVEINSPVFKYLEDVLSYFTTLQKRLGPTYIAKNPGSTGGGTHIHIGLSNTLEKIDEDFKDKLMTIIWNRPWLTWAFQDPSDDTSSIPICYNGLTEKDGEKCSASIWNRSYQTVELRVFDATNSIDDIKAYVKTANHLVKLALNSPEKRSKKYTHEELLKFLVKGNGLKEFQKFKRNNNIKYPNNNFLQSIEWAKESKTVFYNTTPEDREEDNDWFSHCGLRLPPLK